MIETAHIGGFPAHNPAQGWYLTDAYAGIHSTTITHPEISIPGWPGQVQIDGVEDVPSFTLVWSIAESKIAELRAVIYQHRLEFTLPGIGSAVANVKDFTAERHGMGDDPEHTVTVQLVLPGVWLRGAEVTDQAGLTADEQTVDVLRGSDGKVHDGALLLAGPLASGTKVEDVGGRSWLRIDRAIAEGTVLRYDLALGRAWESAGTIEQHLAADPTGTEVTASITTGPAHYGLRITPSLVAPGSPVQPQLRVTSSGRGGSSAIALRARPALYV